MILKKKNKGFTLIELILVMGLSTTALLAYLKYESAKSDQRRAQIVGEQFKDVGDALTTYLSKESAALLANIPTNTTTTLNMQLLRNVNSNGTTGSGNCYPAVPSVLCGRPYLPTTFTNSNAFGSNYVLQVRNESAGLTGLVLSSAPVCKERSMACSGLNPVRLDLAGYAVRSMGANGGLVATGTSTVTGYNAGWSENNARFGGINATGQIAFRSGSSLVSSVTFDNMYLKLDGTNTMRGNINAGNWDINNATNITYNGWLSGFGVLANTLNTGTINNSGSINTTNLFATNVVEGRNYVYSGTGVVAPYTGWGNGAGDVTAQRYLVGQSAVISNNVMRSAGEIRSETRVVAMNDMSTRDIYLGASNTGGPTQGNSGRAMPNAWLSDLLPRYSSRGIRYSNVPANSYVNIPRPDCGPVGVPKIEIIPQNHLTLGYVNGSTNATIALLDAGVSGTTRIAYVAWGSTFASNPPNPISVTANLSSVTANWLRAATVGPNWQVWYQTLNGGSPPMGVLTHVYCDFQF
jgi:prepilin-type N-terminal cleavage/methylation domain-containing protein